MSRFLVIIILFSLLGCQKVVYVDTSANTFHPVLYEGIPTSFKNSDDLHFSVKNAEISKDKNIVTIIPTEVNKTCVVTITDAKGNLVKEKIYMVRPKPRPRIRLSSLYSHAPSIKLYSKRLVVEHYIELMNEEKQELNVLAEITSFTYELFDGEDLIEKETTDNTLFNINFLNKMRQLNNPGLIFTDIVIKYQDSSEYIINEFVVPEEQLVLE